MGRVQEALELSPVGVRESVDEVAVPRLYRSGDAGFDRPHRGAGAQPHDDAVAEAEYLHPHVIAAGVVAHAAGDAEGSTLEAKHRSRGIDVVVPGESRRVGLARRVNLDHRPVDHPRGDVEVVDRQVAPDAAGHGDIFLRRRRGVVRCHPDELNVTQPARAHSFPGGAITSVKPALKSDLDKDLRPLRVIDHRVRRREVERDGFLAKSRHPCVRGHVEQRRMCGSRRGDHKRVDTRLEERLGRLDDAGAEPTRDFGRAFLVHVRDGQPIDLRQHRQVLRVKGADSPDADQTYMHLGYFRL